MTSSTNACPRCGRLGAHVCYLPGGVVAVSVHDQVAALLADVARLTRERDYWWGEAEKLRKAARAVLFDIEAAVEHGLPGARAVAESNTYAALRAALGEGER